MTLDPKSTAVVLIEYQNDFTTDGDIVIEGKRGLDTFASTILSDCVA
jgi:nicotinamidase-related amidase